MTKLKNLISHIRRKLGMDTKLNVRLAKLERKYREDTKEAKGICDLPDFLNLLNIAEYSDMGKTKAIILAYRLGYMQGYEDVKDKIFDYFGNEVVENEQ